MSLTASQQAQAAAISSASIATTAAANNIGDTIAIQLKENVTQTTFTLVNKGTPALGTFTLTPNIGPTNFTFTAPNVITDLQPDEYSDPPISTKSLLLFVVTFSASKALGAEKTYQYCIEKTVGGVPTELFGFTQPIKYFNAPETHTFYTLVQSQNLATYRLSVKNTTDTTAITISDCNIMATRLRTY
jgi:hypothetical protein